MAVRPASTQEMSVWQLLEEVMSLLRRLPVSAWTAYGAGAIPFVVGLLFFWGEMSQSAQAERHRYTAALGMVGLFLWLKAWQAVFCEHLLAVQGCREPERWSCRRILHLLTLQAAVQPWALVALPVALVVALPFGWVYAFFQNFSAMGRGQEPSLRVVVQEAWRCACWAPRQNHYLLSWLFVIALVALLNWISALVVIPYLLKAWLGVETWFSRSSSAYWNLTFFAVVGALTWLAVDPLVKAAYTLRCFYAQARISGEDLKAELRRLQRAWVPVWLMLAGLFPLAVSAASPPVVPPAPVPAAQLEQALDRTLQRREFTWRLPREMVRDTTGEEAGFIRAFFQEVGETLAGWWEGVTLTLDKIERWLDRVLGRRRLPTWSPDNEGVQTDWLSPLRVILALLVAGMTFWLLRWLWRWRRRRQQPPSVAVAAAETPGSRPDLSKEEISPALLPEEEWLALGRDLAARGEWRLALRALYLSALAGLARRELLVLARGKGNREYERELARRAHQHPGVTEPFQALLRDFERVWYGRHAATAELYQAGEEQLNRLQSA